MWSREGRAKTGKWKSRNPRPGLAYQAAKGRMGVCVFPGVVGGDQLDLSRWVGLGRIESCFPVRAEGRDVQS